MSELTLKEQNVIEAQLRELKSTVTSAVHEALTLVPVGTSGKLFEEMMEPQNQTEGFASEGDLLDGMAWIFSSLIEYLDEDDPFAKQRSCGL
jgi:hypothetical protein